PIEERKDGLLKMIQAQHKFLPAGVNGRAGARARCHIVSPFVGERRGQFVAWENQMATFLGYNRDTVAVALNYFDRYTCEKRCSPTLAQAVAATALHIAAKFEETNPASLRQLLKYTPVFTPEQLLVMEMSLLKVLNWDLRPVTVYDFVRAFCALLVQGEASSHAAAASASGGGGVSVSVSLQAREEKKEELERLRVWAEDIAALASFDVRFVDFLPSTLATAALLLSASRGGGGGAAATAAASVRPTSHADVLDACWKGPAEADAASDGAAGAAVDGCGGTGVASLRRVLECVQLLGSSLAERYPAVASAARSAAEGVARYAGLPVPRGTSSVPPRREPAARKRAAAAAATPPVVAVKGRRCTTPTGVEGIMHIEMDTLRGDEAGLQQQQQQPSEHKPPGGADGASAGGGGGAPVGGEGLAPAGSVHVKQEHQQPQRRHRRPTPIITAAAGAANNGAAGQPRHQHHTRARAGRRSSWSSFACSDDDIAFSRATKQKRAAAAATATATATAAAMAAVTSASAAASPRATAVDAGGDVNGAVAAGSAVMSCNIRKRSAEALGHCESGSGFGAPAARRRLVAGDVAGKAMRVSVSAAGSAALPPAAGSACMMTAVAATGVNGNATGSRN
ncbi:unnamed protein product, partial [Ectocarpus sp. 6 AP-2014]